VTVLSNHFWFTNCVH